MCLFPFPPRLDLVVVPLHSANGNSCAPCKPALVMGRCLFAVPNIDSFWLLEVLACKSLASYFASSW
jgi:hypothetical protein